MMLFKKDGTTVIDLQLAKDDSIADTSTWGCMLLVKTYLGRLFIVEEDLYTITEII